MQFGPATRAEGLARMAAFVPRMGRHYAAQRNFDNGPGRHDSVSCLSPWLRRRLITEEEVAAAAIDAHGPEGAEKFVQEVIWRGYFKGWLERRPGIWAAYRDGLARDLTALANDAGLRARVEAAEAGATGIDCFDAWAHELVATGYLHNHARMWFASLWIFTLRLPWRLGADFFYRHLLDGDPASNTLSWRWVAGLHTRGKFYEAKAWNIAKYTDQRFAPDPSDLAEVTAGLEDDEPEGLPAPTPLRRPHAPDAVVPTALLITEEECCPEAFDLARFDIRAVATLAASQLRSPRGVAEHVAEFETGALRDAAARMGGADTLLRAGAPEDLAHWAAAAGARQIVTGYVPEGPLRDWLRDAAPALEAAGVTLCELQRDWDLAIWPHAKAGFFKVKKRIPTIITQRQLL